MQVSRRFSTLAARACTALLIASTAYAQTALPPPPSRVSAPVLTVTPPTPATGIVPTSTEPTLLTISVPVAVTSAAPTPAPAPSVALTPSQSVALAHYAQGRQAYAGGHYRLAARELEDAYAIDPTGTNLLFNLGMVYERLGDVDRAARAYTRYLDHVDDDAERARTQRILARLQGARSELASLRRTHGRADGLFWATTGAAIVGTAVGVSWLGTRQDNAGIEPAVGLTVGGVALGILATVLYFAREGSPSWPPSLAQGFVVHLP